MATPTRRVAVIGTGPAGAIATDALAKEQAFGTIRVFERQANIGGTWVLNRDEQFDMDGLRNLLDKSANSRISIPSKLPCQALPQKPFSSNGLRFSGTASHKHLHSNLPPEIMAFTQEPIPDVLSERVRSIYGSLIPFRHRGVIQKWVEGIFERGNYGKLIEFNTTVELAEKVNDEWILTLRKSEQGASHEYWWQETFDHVVVATGHYHRPQIPSITGLVEFEERYPGTIKHTKHFTTAEEFKNKRVIVVGGSVSAFDALHDIHPVTKHPVISSLRKPSAVFGWTPFTHPKIVNRPEIQSFDAESGKINFSDGSVASGIDHVLFATGYEFSFPFLPKVKPINGRVPGLYQHVFQTSDPSLAFLGMVTGGFGLRIFEWQAVAVARVFAGGAKLPTIEAMQLWEQDRVEKRGDGPAFWTLLPDFEEHFEALRSIAGDPVPGTTGRVLPKYDAHWAEIFWQFVKLRNDWWEREAAEAQSISSL